eukprot:7861029-Pyramimonas_sp.AAC.1
MTTVRLEMAPPPTPAKSFPSSRFHSSQGRKASTPMLDPRIRMMGWFPPGGDPLAPLARTTSESSQSSCVTS